MDGEVGSSWLLFVLLFVGTVLIFVGKYSVIWGTDVNVDQHPRASGHLFLSLRGTALLCVIFASMTPNVPGVLWVLEVPGCGDPLSKALYDSSRPLHSQVTALVTRLVLYLFKMPDSSFFPLADVSAVIFSPISPLKYVTCVPRVSAS